MQQWILTNNSCDTKCYVKWPDRNQQVLIFTSSSNCQNKTESYRKSRWLLPRSISLITWPITLAVWYKINGFIVSVETVLGMAHFSCIGLPQIEPTFITDEIFIIPGSGCKKHLMCIIKNNRCCTQLPSNIETIEYKNSLQYKMHSSLSAEWTQNRFHLACSFAMLSRFASSGIFPLEPISLLLCAHRDGKPSGSMVIWRALSNCPGTCIC